jgi:hypothetical protein
MGDGKQWNRRGFNVTPAGFYTVLSPARWFSTLQLPSGYRYQIREDGKPRRRLAEQGSPKAEAVDATLHLQLVGSTEGSFSWLRFGVILLAAIVLTFGLLFCCGGVDELLNYRHLRHQLLDSSPCNTTAYVGLVRIVACALADLYSVF